MGSADDARREHAFSSDEIDIRLTHRGCSGFVFLLVVALLGSFDPDVSLLTGFVDW